MTVVPLVSLVSVVVSVRCFGDSGACSAPGVLGVFVGALVTVVPVVPLVSLVSVVVSVRCFGDSGACGAFGVLGVCCCFCEVLW